MNQANWLAQLQAQPLIAVLRSPALEIGCKMVEIAIKSGFRQIEITWTSEQPERLVAQIREQFSREYFPELRIGAGTLLTQADLQNAIAAGAQFGFSPVTDIGLLKLAAQHDWPLIPGALTPNEIYTAWQAGAACVKVFPIKVLGGPDYIRCLQGPLPQIPLIPTGGIQPEQIPAYLAAGAIAVGLSSSIFPKAAIATQDWSKLTQQCDRCVAELQASRKTLPASSQTREGSLSPHNVGR